MTKRLKPRTVKPAWHSLDYPIYRIPRQELWAPHFDRAIHSGYAHSSMYMQELWRYIHVVTALIHRALPI